MLRQRKKNSTPRTPFQNILQMETKLELTDKMISKYQASADPMEAKLNLEANILSMRLLATIHLSLFFVVGLVDICYFVVLLFIGRDFSFDEYSTTAICTGLLLILAVTVEGMNAYQGKGMRLHLMSTIELLVHVIAMCMLRLEAERLSDFLSDLEDVPLRFRTEQHYMQLQIVRVGALLALSPFLTGMVIVEVLIIFITLAVPNILTAILPGGQKVSIVGTASFLIFEFVLTMLLVTVNKRISSQISMMFREFLMYQMRVREEEKRKDLKAAKARAMVQHGMKNICASMSACCEVAIEDDEATVESLKEELRQLEGLASMGVTLCNKRAKMSMVEDDNFIAQECRVDVKKMIFSVVRLSPRIRVCPLPSSKLWALGDSDIIYFILENALTNALHHGLDGTTVDLEVSTSKHADEDNKDDDDDETNGNILCGNGSSGDRFVRISISNAVKTGFILNNAFECDSNGVITNLTTAFDTFSTNTLNRTSRGTSKNKREQSKSKSKKTKSKDAINSRDDHEHEQQQQQQQPQPPIHRVKSSSSIQEIKTRGLSEGLGMRIIHRCCKKAKYRCRFHQPLPSRVTLTLVLARAEALPLHTPSDAKRKRQIGIRGKDMKEKRNTLKAIPFPVAPSSLMSSSVKTLKQQKTLHHNLVSSRSGLLATTSPRGTFGELSRSSPIPKSRTITRHRFMSDAIPGANAPLKQREQHQWPMLDASIGVIKGRPSLLSVYSPTVRDRNTKRQNPDKMFSKPTLRKGSSRSASSLGAIGFKPSNGTSFPRAPLDVDSKLERPPSCRKLASVVIDRMDGDYKPSEQSRHLKTASEGGGRAENTTIVLSSPVLAVSSRSSRPSRPSRSSKSIDNNNNNNNKNKNNNDNNDDDHEHNNNDKKRANSPKRKKREKTKSVKEDESSENEEKYKICCVEDEGLIRKMYKRILIRKYFHPDSLLLGEKANEVITAASTIMESGDISAVVLDQNLVYNGQNYLGTDVSKQLRALGYTGVILMRSANTEREDVEFYLSAGADGYLEKSMSSKTIAHEVKSAIALARGRIL